MGLPNIRERCLVWTMPWLAPLIATLISWVLSPVLPKANYAMIYLAGVLLTAVTTRVKPALVCAVLSFLTYNFFHTEPHFTFFMVHQEDILTVTLLIFVAVVTGHLAARLREKVIALEDSSRWNQQQMLLAQELSACVNGPSVMKTLAQHLTQCFSFTTQTYYPGSDELTSLTAKYGLSSPHIASAATEVIFKEDKARVLVAFNSHRGCMGLLKIESDAPLTSLQRSGLDGFIGLARLAWSRVVLSETLQQEITVKEREQLRSALLSSISHDLRTPLATMIGSVSSLIELRDALDQAQQDELLQNTLSEAQRLNRYIQKLLDMTRLGHGELTLDRDWVGLDDILSVVIKRSKPLLQDVTVDISLPPEMPLLYVHPALIEQALFNVLENAIRFAPPGTAITVSAFTADTQLHIDIHDEGPGIPPESWDSIFDMFFTMAHGDQYPAGTGLGLAICQGILGAHGGSASVFESDSTSGTTLRLSLPLPETQLSSKSDDDDTYTGD
ncbi:sensor histidine kinase [Amphritea pacifica]|uniref:histidine kinase n=1 Tax=Amphritea pacifica TaxID=2811233 RepID=A0ABS2WCA7_9GAMM|nr:DUF4118 domain-containing protein [Amphritea pacifica]MBN0989354.1 DUF4118 domain-containing protein [Amphritea pacifica]